MKIAWSHQLYNDTTCNEQKDFTNDGNGNFDGEHRPLMIIVPTLAPALYSYFVSVSSHTRTRKSIAF